MRYTIFKRGGYSQGVIGTTGGEVAGKVILSRNPIGTNEASTKNYVDIKFNALPVGSFTSGIINAGRVPEFAGDIVKLEGNANTTVKTTTVSAGMYPKVTVNIKGQITGGATLVEGDIPVLPWSKIATGKPTTIGGYGISDCLSTSGGVITGSLKVSEVTSDAKCLVNKSYMDSYATGGGSGVSVGGIIYRNSPTTPTGFLKCNGGEVSKTTYAALYGVIGDLFSYDTQPGAGKPWKQQYDINTSQSTDITGWTTGTSLPVTLSWSQAIVTKNRVYLLGGRSSASAISGSTVYTAPINADGTLGSWSTGTSLPGALAQSQVIVTKNRVYLLGGYNGNSYVSTVYTAPINADGTLGAWTTGTSLPRALGYHQAIVTKNRVYLLGGWDAGLSYVSTVYTAPINADGTLGTWTTGTSLPEPLGGSQAIVTKNRVYLLGGHNGGSWVSTIYTAPINEDGTLGAWTTGTPLPGALPESQAIVTKNRVYLLGGFNNSGTVSTVYSAPINADGTLGTWNIGPSLPGALSASQAIVTKNRVYLLGGSNNYGIVSTVYTAPFSGGSNDYSSYYDGSIGTVTNSDNFRLPTLTPNPSQSFAYIKY